MSEVAERLGVTTKSLYEWVKRYGDRADQLQATKVQDAEFRRLKTELKRVTEERDILERPQGTLPESPSKVRVYQGASPGTWHPPHVSGTGCPPQQLLDAWVVQPESARSIEDQSLLGLIKQSWLESGCVYGFRKVFDDLR